jgi:hypothetical protein
MICYEPFDAVMDFFLFLLSSSYPMTLRQVDSFPSFLVLLSTSPYGRQFVQIEILSLPKPELKFLGLNTKLYRGLEVV